MVEKCLNCPRHCNVDRHSMTGFCNEYNKIRIAKVINNFNWEEPCINGEKGACAIFFSGCNLQCSYCQNHEISNGQKGQEYTVDNFIGLLKNSSKINSYIDLITPTHFSQQILSSLKIYKPNIPIIYNTSGYEDENIIEALAPYIDIFLFDLKYCNNSVGQKFSNCNDYFSKASNSLNLACQLKKDIYNDDNMLQGVCIRHLVLPGEVQNSLEVLNFISENLSDRKISIMSQFTPNGKGKPFDKLKPIEYKIIISHAKKLGLTNGYFQDINSSNACYVPDFNNRRLKFV